jgi:DNA-directed RNA polymerase III subunit RPC6
MSTVKAPNRKMYILAGLQPSEEATGGAWFTDGALDHELLEILAKTLEKKISQLSWKHAIDSEDYPVGSAPVGSRKRKEPHGGFDSTGKGKAKMRPKDAEGMDDVVPGSSGAEDDDHEEPQPQKQHSETKRSKKIYVPYPAGYPKYPTLKELTIFVNENDFMVQTGKIPESSISQLLDVMVYDDRLIKISPSPDGSGPTMYKSRKNYAQISADNALEDRVRDDKLDETRRMKAVREYEMNKLGNGGMTEVPCGRCPVFDMCEVGGPVNPSNCEYFEEWFAKLESRSKDAEDVLAW